MELALDSQLCYNRPVGISAVIDHREQDEHAPSDAAHISHVLNGDRNAFAFILEKYKMYVLKIVNRHIPYEDAEEVAHDAFIRIYESLAKFTGPEGFKQWMAAITTRTCYDYWRKAYRSKEVPISSLGEEHQEWLERVLSDGPGGSLEEIGAATEARDLLNWALGKLTPEDRMVLELVYMEGLSVREVANLLGWSTANVKIRSFRSRAKLHKLLKGLIRV
ncbi:MAG: ECF RNA polymerase sigma-E factor [Syntrophorhabdus sp. PtaU1.Bin002]|nr:MAG: ECF RNA polymerase sigma-E factor [Syntrophorhabdus sp. PtaU1.Bin002]